MINENWHLVDLPGYGYARVSKAKKKVFQSFITNYFRERKQLISAFVLIDIRHQPQEIDLKFIEWLGNNEIPFALVFTKADKLKPQAATRNLEQYKEEMLATLWESLPPIFVTSSLKGTGGDALLAYIDELNQLFKESSKF